MLRLRLGLGLWCRCSVWCWGSGAEASSGGWGSGAEALSGVGVLLQRLCLGLGSGAEAPSGELRCGVGCYDCQVTGNGRCGPTNNWVILRRCSRQLRRRRPSSCSSSNCSGAGRLYRTGHGYSSPAASTRIVQPDPVTNSQPAMPSIHIQLIHISTRSVTTTSFLVVASSIFLAWVLGRSS